MGSGEFLWVDAGVLCPHKKSWRSGGGGQLCAVAWGWLCVQATIWAIGAIESIGVFGRWLGWGWVEGRGLHLLSIK